LPAFRHNGEATNPIVMTDVSKTSQYLSKLRLRWVITGSY